MIELDTTRFKTKPFAHQLEGTKALLRYPAFALFDEMGAGKSKQVVDAACALHAAGEIDTVLVICPASVRTVWLDPEIGQIKQHAWVDSSVWEYHSKVVQRWWSGSAQLTWIVTNYEFLRSEERLNKLKNLLSKRVILVLDESSYIKSRAAQQTKAVWKIRELCARCVLLNGTPVTDSPLDLWSQLNVLDKTILGVRYKNYYHFRNHVAVMGGWKMKQVVRWKNLDELSELVKPRVLCRLKKDCLDLPPKLYTQREVALTPGSWKRYQELKKEALLHLSETDMVMEPNAAVRVMRLAQLTSGYTGGVTSNVPDKVTFDGNWGDLSSEKLDWCVEHLKSEWTGNAAIVWCRFRRERERLTALLRENTTYGISELYGGQPKHEREAAVTVFSTPHDQRRVLVAQPHAGGHGLNLVAASHVVYLSNDFSLGIRLQSEDRCHRPGQYHPVTYVDVLAVGPTGQRTIDYHVLKALRSKEEVLRWTTSRWKKELDDE